MGTQDSIARLRLSPRQWYPDWVWKVECQLPTASSFRLFAALLVLSLSGEPDYFGRNKISSGGDLSHYSSAPLY